MEVWQYNEILLEKWSKKIIDQTYIQHKSTSRSQSGQLRWYHTLQVKFDLLVKILIFITVDIFKHTAKKNKKIKRADQILPEVYGTTLRYRKSQDRQYNAWPKIRQMDIH